MLSGDGYIFRLRLTNGVLSFARAKTFAALARRFGNGAFDLSARGNLQMRGISGADIEPLQQQLIALGLLDSDARAESVRNVVPSPLAGFDPTALLDARPLVVELETLLTSEKYFHDLPPKFGFSIDGGGALTLSGVAADIAFTAMSGAPPRLAPRLALSLGGAFAGALAPENLGAAVRGLVTNFYALRGEDRRMSAVVARLGVLPLLNHLHAVIASEAKQSTARAHHSVDCFAGARNDGGEAADYRPILGAHPGFVGAALLFGRIEADELEALANVAEQAGAAELRLTPWRALLTVGLDEHRAQNLAAELSTQNLILDPADPRLPIAACPGAPACPSAKADVRALALALAPYGRGRRVHVSGCVKGCALHAKALTIVAEDDGFSWIDDGLARDVPAARVLDFAALQARLQGAPV
jgi:precorrin-3B synthase